MKKIEDIYSLWYKVFSIAYVPQLMDREKWTVDGESLKVHDIIYFKYTESPMGATWRISKVEHCKVGRDGICRIVGIAYRNKDEKESRVIERPVREVVRLFNIDDTSHGVTQYDLLR